MATRNEIRALIDAALRHDVVLFPFGSSDELAVAFRTPPPTGLIEELYANQTAIVAELNRTRRDDREVTCLEMQCR